MIPKRKEPTWNRERRRHPKRFASLSLPSGSGMPWLLYGLMRRGGFMAGEQISVARPLPSTGGKSFVSRLWAKAKRMIGG